MPILFRFGDHRLAACGLLGLVGRRASVQVMLPAPLPAPSSAQRSTVPPMPSSTSVALITGAGSGIGRAIALRLGREGWRLALVGRDSSRLRETDELLAAGRRVPEATELIVADLADASSARAAVDSTVERFGRLDGLVNNAGAVTATPIDEITEASIAEMFGVNTFAPMHMTSAAWPTFRRQRSGVVVNISSIASFDPLAGFLVYGASKAAVDGVTRSTAADGTAIGVKAYSICPGAVETRMLRSVLSTEIVPLDRALDPGGVAEVAWECLAGMREFDNGRAIPVVRK